MRGAHRRAEHVVGDEQEGVGGRGDDGKQVRQQVLRQLQPRVVLLLLQQALHHRVRQSLRRRPQSRRQRARPTASPTTGRILGAAGRRTGMSRCSVAASFLQQAAQPGSGGMNRGKLAHPAACGGGGLAVVMPPSQPGSTHLGFFRGCLGGLLRSGACGFLRQPPLPLLDPAPGPDSGILTPKRHIHPTAFSIFCMFVPNC